MKEEETQRRVKVDCGDYDPTIVCYNTLDNVLEVRVRSEGGSEG